jgi:hypothetical protein
LDNVDLRVPSIEVYGGYTVDAEWPKDAIPAGFDVVVRADASELDPGWMNDPNVIRLD